MTNRITLVLFLLIAGPLLYAQTDVSRELPMNVEAAVQKYRLLGDNWKAKREFCIECIDAGLIKRGAYLADTLRIFGDDVRIFSGNITTKCFASVFFEKQEDVEDSHDDSIARGFHGWYMDVDSDINGSIESYSLSNLHK